MIFVFIGVEIDKNTIPIKSSWLMQEKSCNYLPNALMKKEVVDRNFDFVAAFYKNGNFDGCAPENIIIMDKKGIIDS